MLRIGAALARRLASLGARLALSARGREQLEAVAADCPGAVVVPMDVACSEDQARAVDEVVAALGGIDLAVFAAGSYRPVRAWELEPEEIRATIATNLTGTMEGVARVVRPMLARGGGAVAVVASVAGYCGLPKDLRSDQGRVDQLRGGRLSGSCAQGGVGVSD